MCSAALCAPGIVGKVKLGTGVLIRLRMSAIFGASVATPDGFAATPDHRQGRQCVAWAWCQVGLNAEINHVSSTFVIVTSTLLTTTDGSGRSELVVV